jgi:hypothetical protein
LVVESLPCLTVLHGAAAAIHILLRGEAAAIHILPHGDAAASHYTFWLEIACAERSAPDMAHGRTFATNADHPAAAREDLGLPSAGCMWVAGRELRWHPSP